MIFNVPNHIQYIRNGLSKRFINSHGVPARIVKTQTRRLNRGIYKVGKGYAVQRKRGVKAEKDIRIVMDRIWEEYCYQAWLCIPPTDALAEGGYKSDEFERVFRELNPEWNGISRWTFEFHVIEVYTNEEKEIYRKFDGAQKELDKGVRRNVPGITRHAREERVKRIFYPEQTAGYPRL